MEHLYKTVSKKGNSFLETIFNKPLKIAEKIDGTALIVKKQKNGTLDFFGREGSKRIGKTARMFSTMYDAGIEHLKSQNLTFMKVGEELHFEYFAPNVNHIVQYNNIPSHGLVLLFSTTSRRLESIAKDIGVLAPPIIFNGKLNDSQKDELTKFLIMSPELRQVKYKTDSFTKFIITTLNKNYLPILGNSDIEGVVISTSDGQFLSKIVDPMFTDKIMAKKDNDELKSEYHKKLSNIITHFNFRNIEDFKTNKTDPEERYIEFMLSSIESNLSSLMKFKEDFAKFEYGNPYKVTYTDFNYNKFPKVMRTIIKDNPWFKDLIRLMFTNLQKTKKRATKNFDKESVKLINTKIELIKKYVLQQEFNESQLTIWDNKIIEESVGTYGIMLGRFQPVTTGHMKAIEQMAKEVDKGTLILVKGKASSKDKESNPFDTKIQTKLLKAVLPSNIDIVITSNGFFPDVVNDIDATDFNVYAGTDRVKSYERMKSYIDSDKNVNIKEIKRTGADVSATKVRQSLKDEDEELFKSMTPKGIHRYYNELVKIIKG